MARIRKKFTTETTRAGGRRGRRGGSPGRQNGPRGVASTTLRSIAYRNKNWRSSYARGAARSGVRPGRSFARAPPRGLFDARSALIRRACLAAGQTTAHTGRCLISTLRVCIWSMHAANTWLGSEVHALIDAPDDRRAFRSVKRMRAFLVQLLAARDLAPPTRRVASENPRHGRRALTQPQPARCLLLQLGIVAWLQLRASLSKRPRLRCIHTSQSVREEPFRCLPRRLMAGRWHSRARPLPWANSGRE